MATPTLSGGITNAANTIDTADTITGWSGVSLESQPDIKVEGTNSVQGIMRNDGQDLYFTAGTAINMTGQTIRGWINFQRPAELDFMEFKVGNAFWNINKKYENYNRRLIKWKKVLIQKIFFQRKS